MRIAFTGGRHYVNYELVYNIVASLDHNGNVTILVGDATGLDTMVATAAKQLGFQTEVFVANWQKYDNAAGPIRNKEMLEAGAKLLIAFQGGRGTTDCVRQARKLGIPILHVEE